MTDSVSYKYFLSYTGLKLPLNFVSPVDLAGVDNRNTYFRASYDARDRLVLCEKIVYGEVELRHQYEYTEDGVLIRAKITSDREENEVSFAS